VDGFMSLNIDHKRKEATMDRYIESRETSLLMHLLTPKPGERILALLNGREDVLKYLKTHGCQVTLLDFPPDSPKHIDEPSKELFQDELPFSDNEFDVVVLMTSLEFAKNPKYLIAEAIRVSRGRVCIGVDNRHSMIGLKRRMDELFRREETKGRQFTVREIKKMVGENLGNETRIHWGSVIFLPYGWYRFAAPVEEYIPVIGNPFGAFMGLSFSVTYRYRTIQDAIKPFNLGIKAHQFTGSVRRDTTATSLRFSVTGKTKNA
jgi:ubiquinone/menaquinone biosynthesis C-methylase UbiE